jgi:predicted PurR-regulated permease PerM
VTRTTKVAFLVALAVALIVFAYFLRAIFMPLLVALLLAYILNPVLNALERRKVPRLASIAGVYAVLLGIVAGLVLWAVPQAFSEAKEFVQVTFTGPEAKIKKLEPYLQRWLRVENTEELFTLLRRKAEGHYGEIAKVGGTVAGAVLAFATQSISGFVTVISFIALVPVYLFFLLKNMNGWWERVKHCIPRAYRDRTLSTLDRIHRANASFFRGQITISAIEGVIVFAGLLLIDVKFALLFGFLYAILSLIPYLGVAVGFTVTEVFVLADTGHFGKEFFLVAGLFVLIQVLEATVLQPMILGKETGLHPIAIILALLLSGELFGLFGMLIGVPVAATVKILFQDYVWPVFQDVADLTRVRPRPPDVSPSELEPPPPTPAPSAGTPPRPA